ncbi:hypothetical protein PIB30_037115 [Stylosanthes scabra]|uniref:SH2 domain-containing protein n=1 Tax=Stylosanthes scabra TaxID=79078 RepID=A0ABU6ZC30_9FABA|nr:hypothetical protein [Stylosanthes scabra]
MDWSLIRISLGLGRGRSQSHLIHVLSHLVLGHVHWVEPTHNPSLRNIEVISGHKEEVASLNPTLREVSAECFRDEREKALKTKKICENGDFLFRISNEDDLLVRLAGQKLQNQSKGETVSRRRGLGRRITGIKGIVDKNFKVRC